ncbi:MAG TPA: DEAD/DEAH box helicase [Nakamurella sp.]|nr:DEAD/DEAH box helicase [Nakamurella sp.]
MTNPRSSARARSAAPSDRRTPAAGDRFAPASGDRQSGRRHNGSETPSRHRASRPAGPAGAFSVGAFSSGAQSTGPLTTGTMPAIARPSSSRPADRLNRQAPAPVSALPTSRNEGRRRRQRGAESTLGATMATARPAQLPAFVPADPGQEGLSFAELGVPTPLLPALTGLGAVDPFPIQSATLPATLAGRDVLGRGKTGSGKTIAFAIPLVTRLTGGKRTPRRPRGLILLPTRELALQVQRTVEPLAQAAGLRTVVVFGGVGYGNQTAALQRGVDIVIACPGRLEDLISQRFCDLSAVEVTVLDEADHMADLGFLPGVRRILRATPAGGQRMLFSATLDNGISVLVNDFLSNPVLHAVDDVTSPVAAMSHHVFAVSSAERTQVIRELAAGQGRRLLFTRTKHGAKKWAATLSKYGIPAVDLHGNLSQGARERNLAAFSSGSAKVLVATDIAARGIHVDDIELVVHLDPPTEHKAYLHRSGRTARAGAGGTVVTVMLPEQADDVRKLMKQAGIAAATIPVTPGHPAINKIAG